MKKFYSEKESRIKVEIGESFILDDKMYKCVKREFHNSCKQCGMVANRKRCKAMCCHKEDYESEFNRMFVLTGIYNKVNGEFLRLKNKRIKTL